MRLFFLLLIAFFLYIQPPVAVFATSVFTDCSITSVLRIGSRGAEVECLQGKLGIATDGIFGPWTHNSVISFQSKNGLVPDGVIGPISRTALNVATAKKSAYPAGCTSTTVYSPTTGVKCDETLTIPVSAVKNNKVKSPQKTINQTAKIPANLVSLDNFIATVIEVNKKKVSSETELNRIADTLRQEVLTSNIDYKKEFKNLLQRESELSANIQTPAVSLFNKIKSKALSFLGIMPTTAQAQAGVPFGGALLFPFFCSISGNWMIAVQPLPPTYVALLSYFPGTQGFAGYNIPVTTYLLGTYVPAGVCSYGTVTITTEGTITPMVGSSAI